MKKGPVEFEIGGPRARDFVPGRHAALLPDFAIFREQPIDRAGGPEMVVVPAGSFLMGSVLGDDKLEGDDKACKEEIIPGHGKRLIRIPRRFAIGRYPATFIEYDAFCAATGAAQPEDEGWGRERRPVINVSWDNAIAYIGWLNTQLSLISKERYRLPSEAEWEYTCRAGADTRRWWGDAWDPAMANGDGSFEDGRTSPVDHYGPNQWGLHDMIGNVFEWCADIWAENIAELPEEGAPCAGSDQKSGQAHRVLRGGSWYVDPSDLRSASRYGIRPDARYFNVGFRLARTL